ncbi:DNA polymerase DELTA SUBUNIT 3 [Salix koriyanagi]|uniref:DNA polymerase delta subunit 3 n=1 Tax=Salix koriyanagi TaxID=2511006 RepID=A0A9Q0WZ16_9ROSI|nr:DNA polymerase DELTA SUBUNIT 3 [Salix koriyanagi]
METLGILDEIEVLVSDKVQVVSYKWLSRNFLVSSNAAKRLLQEFVNTRGSGFEVVYTLSGWLKSNPSSYHIRLVSGPKLEEAKQEFNGNCSVQVYSVQACIPKDPAALWNAEFVQAEELFKQSFTVDNCLRDNRFCGIRNSFVKHNVDGPAASIAAPQPKSAEIPVPLKSNSGCQNISALPSKQTKVQQSPNVGPECPNLESSVKSERNGTGVHDLATKQTVDEEKVLLLPAGKKKGQGNRISSGNGGSLSNLWGRASAKSKLSSAQADNDKHIPNPTVSAEAQISACEVREIESSDDEAQGVNFKRASNGDNSRKRMVVFDYSDDEYEDAVNLASPELPKGQSSATLVLEKPHFIKQAEDEPVIKIQSNMTLCDVKKDMAADAAPNSPKRRKVLKTRIDERGREVTEVVWEGEETETNKVEAQDSKKEAANNADTNTANNRAPPIKKSPAAGNGAPSNQGSKPGNKKGGNKDPKQGNILSFFKRV